MRADFTYNSIWAMAAQQHGQWGRALVQVKIEPDYVLFRKMLLLILMYRHGHCIMYRHIWPRYCVNMLSKPVNCMARLTMQLQGPPWPGKWVRLTAQKKTRVASYPEEKWLVTASRGGGCLATERGG